MWKVPRGWEQSCPSGKSRMSTTPVLECRASGLGERRPDAKLQGDIPIPNACFPHKLQESSMTSTLGIYVNRRCSLFFMLASNCYLKGKRTEMQTPYVLRPPGISRRKILMSKNKRKSNTQWHCWTQTRSLVEVFCH